MKKISLFVGLFIPFLSACTVPDFSSLIFNKYKSEGGTDEAFIRDGGEGGSYFHGGASSSESGVPGGGENGEETLPSIPAGQLTCSALDDNKYYDYWKSLANSTQEGKGVFQEYKENFAFNTYNRFNLTVKNGKNIKVKIKDEDCSAYVDNLSKVNLFPSETKETYEVEISYKDSSDTSQTITKTVTDGEEIDLENTFALSNRLELMFVIDATGSMGDEIDYLKAEIDDVISRVKEEKNDANIYLAILMYRDEGDEYVTRYSDFTLDIASQQNFLKQQSANGGGDFEEAVDVALTEAINKQWTPSATKLLFHVADAPSHDKDVSTWNLAVKKAAENGIKIVTVASSGIDKKTEYFFRSQSLLTSGQYVYLTNHSGIGGDHLEPTIQEELVVEYLNDCLVRLVSIYYSGEFIEPVPFNQNHQQTQ